MRASAPGRGLQRPGRHRRPARGARRPLARARTCGSSLGGCISAPGEASIGLPSSDVEDPGLPNPKSRESQRTIQGPQARASARARREQVGIYPAHATRRQGMVLDHSQHFVMGGDIDEGKGVDAPKEVLSPLPQLSESQFSAHERVGNEIATVQSGPHLSRHAAAMQEVYPHGRIDQDHERRRGATSRLLRGAFASGAEPASAASSRLAA